MKFLSTAGALSALLFAGAGVQAIELNVDDPGEL